MTTVDITILSWDRLADTQAAITSALSQQGIELRVIVVDQGSKPENLAQLRKFCRQYAQVNLVCNQHNLGVPGGRNQAALQGDADYIVALDNDAEFIDSGQVARAVALMQQYQDLGAIGFRILRFGSDADDLSSWSYGKPAQEWAGKSFYSTHFVGAGHMLRRSAFVEVGGYDEALFFLEEESELSRKLINCGYRIRYSPEVVIGHKVAAERRLDWSGSRWRYHVRNRIYLNLKFRRPFPSLCLDTLLVLYKGLHAGLIADSLVGLAQGLSMAPRALRARKTQPALRSNAAARAYTQSCLLSSELSRWQRIKRRLRHAALAPGEGKVQSK